jgi:hypothetical protein
MTEVPTFPWGSVELVVVIELPNKNWRDANKEADRHLRPVDVQTDHS